MSDYYRIIRTNASPRWVAFRHPGGGYPLTYVGHGWTREIVRDLVAADREARIDAWLKPVREEV